MTLDADRPCSDWCTIDQAEAHASARAPGTLDQETLTDAIDVASAWLYRLSGRQYPGLCSGDIRPEPFVTSGVVMPRLGEFRRTDRRGRRPHVAREIDLGHSPVTQVDAVYVDGLVVPASSYRVDDDHWLVRIDGESWPNRQDWTLDPKVDDNSGMAVEFSYGLPPPPDGRMAAIVLAVELARAFLDDPACRLPANLQTATREGVVLALAEGQPILEDGRFGIREPDQFLRSANPGRNVQRPRVLNPDHPRLYRRTTSDVGGS
jgi:hypothetical protein